MGFLLAKIAFWLLIAAVAGYLLGRFWLWRQYDDVTTEYSAALHRLDDLESQSASLEAVLARQHQTDARVIELAGMVRRHMEDMDGRPQVDLQPILAHLSSLETQVHALPTTFPEPTPAVDLEPITKRLAVLERHLHALAKDEITPIATGLAAVSSTVAAWKVPDLGPLQKRLAALEQGIAALPTELPEPPAPVDLQPIQQGMSQLETAVAQLPTTFPEPTPAVDLEPITKRLAVLERHLHALAKDEITPIATGLAAVSSTVAAWKVPDLGPLQKRLAALEQGIAALPTELPEPPAPDAVDLNPLHKRLAALEQAVAQLPTAFPEPPEMPTPVDLGPLMQRLATLEAHVALLPTAFPEPIAPVPVDFEPVVVRLGALESQVADRPPFDLSPVLTRLDVLEAQIALIPTSHPEIPASVVVQADPLAEVRRDDSSNLLTRAAFGKPDALQRISGVGPKLERLLHDVGVYYFWQVSRWSDSDVAFVDSKLNAFKGRIERDGWVPQAKRLAAEPTAASAPT